VCCVGKGRQVGQEVSPQVSICMPVRSSPYHPELFCNVKRKQQARVLSANTVVDPPEAGPGEAKGVRHPADQEVHAIAGGDVGADGHTHAVEVLQEFLVHDTHIPADRQAGHGRARQAGQMRVRVCRGWQLWAKGHRQAGGASS
jgi:hypothetical protein